MTKRRRVILAVGEGILAIVLMIPWLMATLVKAQGLAIRAPSPTYVSAHECAACHDENADPFGKTGMAHSFYSVDIDPIGKNLQSEIVYYHPASQTWFSIVRQNGKLYQKR